MQDDPRRHTNPVGLNRKTIVHNNTFPITARTDAGAFTHRAHTGVLATKTLAGAMAGGATRDDCAFAATLGTIADPAFTGTNRTFTAAAALGTINAALTSALRTFLPQLPIGHAGTFTSETFENFITPAGLADVTGPATPAQAGRALFGE